MFWFSSSFVIKSAPLSNNKQSIVKQLLRVAQVLIGLAAMAFLFSQIDMGEFLAAAGRANWLWVALAIVSIFITHGWTWLSLQYQLYVIGQQLPRGWLFLVTLMTQAMGMVAPGKLGDFSIIWFFKRKGIRYGTGFAVAFFQKVIALLSSAWIGLFVLVAWKGNQATTLAAVVLPALGLILWMSLRGWLPQPMLNWLKKGKLRESMGTFLDAWQQHTQAQVIGISMLLGILKAVLMALLPYCLFLSYGHEVSLPLVIAVSSAVRLLTLLPLSPSGLGIRELSGTLLFVELANVPDFIAANVMIMASVAQFAVAGVCYFATIRVFEGEKPDA